MPFARGLLFSLAVPLANLAAIHIVAFLATCLLRGFTPELVEQSLGIIAKQLTLGWFMVLAIAAIVSFGAWLIVQRANSTSGPSRLILLISATLAAGILPAGLALVVFGEPVLGLVVVLAISGMGVFIASRNHVIEEASVSLNLPSSQRMGFGQRDR
ncbi:hypothetical protein [Brevundimonas sp.]|uniref:hypothetical protein n=1 Tax=Brevundimonas sp. TaxID=1871086 RepID=UPI0025C6FD7C|nr:hypothetical protein [Brevundimonas sp.]